MNGSCIAEWGAFSSWCHTSRGISKCKPVCCIWSYCTEPCNTVPVIAVGWQMLLLSWERRWEARTRKRRIASILSLSFLHCVYGHLEQSGGSTNVFKLLKPHLLANHKKQFRGSINSWNVLFCSLVCIVISLRNKKNCFTALILERKIV